MSRILNPLASILIELVLLATALSVSAHADETGTPPALDQIDAVEPEIIVSNFVVDGDELSDAVFLYQTKAGTFAPLGFVSGLLTLDLDVNFADKRASGFVIDTENTFSLADETKTVVHAGAVSEYDTDKVLWKDGDAYVELSLLEQWLPVTFDLKLRNMSLTAESTRQLPYQARREREQKATRLNPGGQIFEDLGYDLVQTSPVLFSISALDNRLGVDISKRDDELDTRGNYSATFAGELLGLDAIGFLSTNFDQGGDQSRFTLSKTDPDAQLLGPLKARTVSFGDVGLPSVTNIRGSAGTSNGVLISNQAIERTGTFETETLRGELPVGWDVTLYYNGALLAFADADDQGRYEFADLPLSYGRNEFELVFNGPYGQRRVETRTFMIDSAGLSPGEFEYQAGLVVSDEGEVTGVAKSEIGVTRNTVMTTALVADQSAGAEDVLALALGARMSLPNAILTAEHATDLESSTHATEIGIKTRIEGIAFDASRSWNDAVTMGRDLSQNTIRDEIRLAGSVSLSENFRLPLNLRGERIQSDSGDSYLLDQRLSGNLFRTAVTNTLTYENRISSETLRGQLNANRSSGKNRFRGQLAYSITPDFEVSNFSAGYSRRLSREAQFNLGFTHAMPDSVSAVNLTYAKDWDKFGIGVTGLLDSRGDFAAGFQLTSSFGRTPKSRNFIMRREPMTGSGAVLAHAFLDKNYNGVRDADEELIGGVKYKINGGVRSDRSSGETESTYIPYLQHGVYANVSLDDSTLADPTWHSKQAGYKILARRGQIQELEFPVVMLSEVDGTVFLADEVDTRGVGNVALEVRAQGGALISSARSAGDGFYILTGLMPGEYTVAVSEEQMSRLGLEHLYPIPIIVEAGGTFVHGIDFILRRKTITESEQVVEVAERVDDPAFVSDATDRLASRDSASIQEDMRGSYEQMTDAEKVAFLNNGEPVQ